MKKITKNNLSKRLAQYGALSLAIAGVADASGQIIYTDVNPDFVGGLTDSFAVDFDGGSVNDVTIIQSNNGNYELVKAMPYSTNGVLAASNGGYFYASNIAYGTPIDAGAGAFRSFGSFCAGVGYAGSQFCGAGPGYIGVQFDLSGSTHYGWVRVDIADSSNFIVMDFAYESTPDMAINAGDKGPLGVGEQMFEGFKYYVTNNQLNLSANTAMEKVVLHNMLGQQIVSQKLNSSSETINLSGLQAGVYIATVSIEGASKTFRIVKN
ncbi:MAG: T9SS type A sorting domain-containing protein [Flavobacteriaceae bacterium]|nr:T9SS type A sorting domain-containing protein [Flavobacteriaceae bacterium]